MAAILKLLNSRLPLVLGVCVCEREILHVQYICVCVSVGGGGDA